MKKIWARIGMSVDVSDELYEKLQRLDASSNEKDWDEGTDICADLFTQQGYMDGNCYMPDFESFEWDV